MSRVREQRGAVGMTYLLVTLCSALIILALLTPSTWLRTPLLGAAMALAWSAVIRAGRAQLRLARVSLVDPLTGLFNRRYMQRRLADEAARVARHGGGFAVCVCDLDNFKAFNDRYGHLEGDRRLRQAGAVLRDAVRRTDLAFRYGGEEFVLLLPECDALRAQVVAERALAGLRGIGLTASLGVADFPSAGPGPDAALACADAACLVAKAAGKNQVVRHHPEPAFPPSAMAT